MKRPAFWILLGLVSLAATAAAVHYFPQAFSIVALDITMTRERALADARAIVTRDRLGPADFRQAASFALDSETQTFVELEGGGKTEFTAHAARAALRRLHLARASLQRRRNERDAGPVHARRPAVRLRRDAEGGCAGRRPRRRRGAAARRSGGARAMERRPRAVHARRAGTGAASGRPRRSHHDLRAIVADPRRRPLSAPARGLGRSADGGHPLRPDPGGVHPPLRQHAVGQRGHRHRLGRRHGAPLRRRRHRHRPLLHAAQPLRAVAAGGDLGRHRRHACRRWRRSTSGR